MCSNLKKLMILSIILFYSVNAVCTKMVLVNEDKSKKVKVWAKLGDMAPIVCDMKPLSIAFYNDDFYSEGNFGNIYSEQSANDKYKEAAISDLQFKYGREGSGLLGSKASSYSSYNYAQKITSDIIEAVKKSKISIDSDSLVIVLRIKNETGFGAACFDEKKAGISFKTLEDEFKEIYKMKDGSKEKKDKINLFIGKYKKILGESIKNLF